MGVAVPGAARDKNERSHRKKYFYDNDKSIVPPAGTHSLDSGLIFLFGRTSHFTPFP
jgi:hypothetical protein